jgi:ubiquinone/menaquinone biosynthesis C-methylase UbiE
VPENMEYYDEIAPGYLELHHEEQQKKLKVISNHLKIDSSERLLDVGCGTGFSREVFKNKIIGIEPAREMLILGKKNEVDLIHEKGEHMDLIQGEGEHLPFSDNSFDYIICVTALHNFHNPELGLQEMKRVGKGKGAITVLKKAKDAEKLKLLITQIFTIEKEIEEEHDIIMFFGLDKI